MTPVKTSEESAGRALQSEAIESTSPTAISTMPEIRATRRIPRSVRSS